MPTRVVRGEIVKSRSLSRVSLEAELLFRNLIALCDDYGRYDGDAEIIAAHAYPRRRSVSPETVESWLAELATADGQSTGPIELYSVEGRRYVRLVNWEIHRGKTRRGSSSRWPEPCGIASEVDPTTSAEAPGSPQVPAYLLGEPPEESGSRGVEESGKDKEHASGAPVLPGLALEGPRVPKKPRRAIAIPCPDELDEEARGRVAVWAREKLPREISPELLAFAWERVLGWARADDARRRNWEQVFKNALLSGWACEGFGRTDPTLSPAEAKAERTKRAAREAVARIRSSSNDLERIGASQ